MPRTDVTTERRALNLRVARALQGALGRHEPLPADASVELRLAHLESQLSEVRSRVNGVFFALVGSLAVELVGRVSL